jgi:D-alanine transaminase/branched-chain amino acid aminotransferase
MIYPYIYINGEILPQEKALIPVYDLGLLRGLGIFDYFRVLEGIPVFAEDHIERLENSLQIMDFNTGLSKEDWLSLFYKMIKANGVERGGFRVVVTGGFSDDGYTIPEKKNIYLMLHGLPASDPAQYEHGVSVLTYAYQRDIPDAKTTVYIESMKAQPRLKEAGAFEILYHWNGDIKECSRCNIFFIDKEGGLHTPARGMLKGITRKQVITIAKEHNITLFERNVNLDELPEMAGAFLTATTKGVLPVVKIDDKPVGNGLVHPVARQLQEFYLKRVDDYLAKAHLNHK